MNETIAVEEMNALPPLRHNQQQVPSQSVQAHNVTGSFLNDMFKVDATVFQQIMTAQQGLRILAFSANGFTRQHYELSKRI
jgi:hypothetical protein